MSTVRLDPARWLSRTAALALLALVVALLGAGLVAPYLRQVAAVAMRIDSHQAILDRYRALLGRPAPATDPAPTLAGLALPGGSPAQAAAALQEILSAFASKAGLRLEGVQVLPSEAAPGPARLSVRVRGRGEMPALERFLYAVEAARPVLVTENLRVQGRRDEPILDIQLEVVGFMAEPAL